MKTSDLVRALCKKQHISLAELSRRIGQSPQNLNKKLKHDTLTVDELEEIAKATGSEFDLGFNLPDGTRVSQSEVDQGRAFLEEQPTYEKNCQSGEMK